MTARIDRLWPDPAQHLTDEELVTRPDGPVLRVNFVSSVDGAVTHHGLSGGLSGAADKRLFELLRRASDVVLVGAGTVRAEGYGGLRVSDASARAREAAGLPAHPVFAIVSGRLDLDPDSPVFTEAPVRPVVFTLDAGGADAFAERSDIIRTPRGPDGGVDVPTMLAALHERGLNRILSEGGPTLFAALLEADAVDELSLTVTGRLEGGAAGADAPPRITDGWAGYRRMRLGRVLRSGDDLLLRYERGEPGD